MVVFISWAIDSVLPGRNKDITFVAFDVLSVSVKSTFFVVCNSIQFGDSSEFRRNMSPELAACRFFHSLHFSPEN
jgi:hypothetical protein